MDGDLLLVCARAAHTLAAAAWVGGAILHAVVGAPVPRPHGRSFPWLVGLCVWVLMLSGAVLTVDRLSDPRVGTLYALLLATKTGLALVLFVLAGLLAPGFIRRRWRPSPAGLTTPPGGRALPYAVLWGGVAVYVLGASLSVLYARTLLLAAGG